MTDARPSLRELPIERFAIGSAMRRNSTDRARDGASGFVQVAAMAAIALNALLPVIELGRIVLLSTTFGINASPFAALLATIFALPLHLRHVRAAVRGERSASAAFTLATLVAVNVAAAFVVGPGWLMNFALLAVSMLLVVPAPWSLPLFAAVVVAPAPLAGVSQDWPGAYLVFSVAWRSVTLFVVVWLVAAFYQLDAARRELRDRAVVRERLRIQTELRGRLGTALEQIASDAALAERDPAGAERALRSLVDASRQTLADARRLIAGYRESSVRAELQAATTLLGAAGIESRIVILNDRALNTVDERSRAVVRAAVGQILRDDSMSRCVIRVGWSDGAVHANVSADAVVAG